jgi:hypothetical protein
MSEQAKLPTNHVMAVIDSHNAALEAADELRSHGFPEARLLRGEAITEETDPKAERAANPVSKAIKAVQDHLSEEPNYLAQYQEEARSGRNVVAVLVEGPEEAEGAREILESHGARNVRFFGRLAVSDLTPESNPTTRSEDSPERQNWAGQTEV